MFMVNVEELLDLRKQIEAGGKTAELWKSLHKRSQNHVRRSGLMQEGDTQEWWHLVWERLSDVSFAHLMTKDELLGEWLHDTTMEIAHKPIDEWIGPWYRPRGNPPQGMLETSHVGLAVSVAYDLCGELFTDQEKQLLRECLYEKCLLPTKRFVHFVQERKNHINNWFMVLLNGYGTCAAVLKDEEAVKDAVKCYKLAASLYNKDSYGESLQYWNYATIHLSHLNEVLTRYRPSLASELEMKCYINCIPWAVQSFLYMKTLAGWGDAVYPRSLNFGDSAAIFRPSGDTLLRIANRAKESNPTEAGLARWLFEQTYDNTDLEPTEFATFGFFNTFQFYSVLKYSNAVDPLSPQEAGLQTLVTFETGSTIVRDSWNHTQTILGIQAGYEPLNVTSHNHEDQGSFILEHLNERFFVDPGHCCYRLKSQAVSQSTFAHNTWSFIVEGNTEPLKQQNITGANVWKCVEPLAKRLIASQKDGISIVRADMANLYGKIMLKAQRTWITTMPNVLFIIDHISAAIPVKTKTNFTLNNRDNRLKVNEYSDTKLVLRRNEAAMKFFLMESLSDGKAFKCDRKRDWGYVHDCYHPLPNQRGQGSEGSGLQYIYENKEFAKEHVFVYAIAMDQEKVIPQWHITNPEPNLYIADAPNQQGQFSIHLSDNGDILINQSKNKASIIIGANHEIN